MTHRRHSGKGGCCGNSHNCQCNKAKAALSTNESELVLKLTLQEIAPIIDDMDRHYYIRVLSSNAVVAQLVYDQIRSCLYGVTKSFTLAYEDDNKQPVILSELANKAENEILVIATYDLDEKLIKSLAKKNGIEIKTIPFATCDEVKRVLMINPIKPVISAINQ
jgi:hypothetical protein